MKTIDNTPAWDLGLSLRVKEHPGQGDEAMGEGRREQRKKTGSNEGSLGALQKTNQESTGQSPSSGDSSLLDREHSAFCFLTQ